MDEPAVYEIEVLGWINERCTDWFEGMSITLGGDNEGDGFTTLVGTVADQAALLSVLQRLFALGLPLLQVKRIATG